MYVYVCVCLGVSNDGAANELLLDQLLECLTDILVDVAVV